jgi:hypothetical protein
MTRDERDDAQTLGCLIVVGLLGIAYWAFTHDVRIWREILAVGAAAFALHWAAKRLRAGPAPATLRARIATELIGDLRRLALWSFLAIVAVLLIQFLLDTWLSHLEPDQVAAAQFRVYDFNQSLRGVVTLRNLMLALASATLLAALLRARWPLIMLGKARKALSAAIAFVGALAGFTFVVADTADLHYDRAVEALHTAILSDLNRIAAARQEHAAFRWLAAELALEQRENPNAQAAWHDFFTQRAEQCRQMPDMGEGPCDPAAQILRDARQRVGGSAGTPPPPAGPEWLWDFRDVTTVRMIDVEGMGRERAYLNVRNDLRSRPALAALRVRAAESETEADAARDAIRDLVVEGVAGLLGESYAGIAGQVADVMRDAMATALAAETDARIRDWWRLRHRSIQGLFHADRRLVSLARHWRYQTITPAQRAAAPAPAPTPIEVATATDTSTLQPQPGADATAASGQRAATMPPSSLATPAPVYTPSFGTTLVIRPQPVILPPYMPPVHATPVRGRF